MGCNSCPDVVKVEALPDLMLKVWFADGKIKLCDCHELSQTRPFRKIQNKYFFSLAKADHWGCVTWPGERDLAPEYLYYDIGVEIQEKETC